MIVPDPTVEQAADIIAINQLADAYTDAICRGDVHDAVQVYASDAVLSYPGGGQAVGHAEIEQAITVGTKDLTMIFNMVHGRLVRVHGDAANARFQISEWSVRAKDGIGMLYLGFYDDELVRTADGWRFSHRRLVSRTLTRAEFFAGKLLPLDALRPSL